MFVAREPKTISTVLGTATTLLRVRAHGMFGMLTVSPTTSTTSYDISITDSYGNVIFEEFDLVGAKTFKPDIPVFANVTLTIDNATANEEFSILPLFIEHNGL